MKKKPSLKNFAGWTSFDVEKLLGYKNHQFSPDLMDWIEVEGEIAEQWRGYVENRRMELYKYQNVWNETDLLSNFIGPLLTTIGFSDETFNHFSERPLEAVVGSYHVNGFVDWMVATGDAEPETPFFFLHEYKKMKGTDADPLGQLLIEMVAVQTLNNQMEEPIYGCYVLGKLWHFVLLQGKTYSISEGFDVTTERELTRVWLVLDKTKGIIAEKALVIWNEKMARLRG